MSTSSPKKTIAINQDSPNFTVKLGTVGTKHIRKISPLGFRVVLRMRKEPNLSEGGLYLPEGAKQNMDEAILGEVIEVASALDDHTEEETNISGVPLGALVLIPKNSGTRVPWDPDLRIVETKEILAIVGEDELV